MDSKLLKKYQPYGGISLPDRKWPDNNILSAPQWCSVDLRDGNQALITPMTLEKKLKLFKLLVDIGFKEIEVGFPSASQVEYDFLRTLIDQNLIPDDVTIQVLTQAREHLIKRTCEAIDGAKNVIIHLYNSTSVLQRKHVFKMSKDEIKKIAVQGTKWVKEYSKNCKSNILFEYSPESFTGTEIEFSLDICEAVMDEWYSDQPLILNLPATVELFTPNIYADMIEWFDRHIKDRGRVILSVHTHNDRGTGVAASELALLAGAQRVEGTLFGNGERTGNVDIVTMALNMYSQGVDPRLDLHNINHILEVSLDCTDIPVHVRHPYTGELVYTAFSGSHQDAINKGMQARTSTQNELWEVPYLLIDPTDLGRSYEAIIRINSQSGKGGVAYIMESEFGCTLPKAMHPEFSAVIQSIVEKTGAEISPQSIWNAFSSHYLTTDTPLEFINYKSKQLEGENRVEGHLTIKYKGAQKELKGIGNGPIAACEDALHHIFPDFQINSYSEHSLNTGSNAEAIAYIQIATKGLTRFGAGIDANINLASIKAIISALNLVI